MVQRRRKLLIWATAKPPDVKKNAFVILVYPTTVDVAKKRACMQRKQSKTYLLAAAASRKDKLNNTFPVLHHQSQPAATDACTT
jgi:hypothetical protein